MEETTELTPQLKWFLNPPSISEIAPRLFLGNFSSSYDVETLKKHSITSTLSLMTEKSPRWMDPHVQHHVSAARRLFIPAVDADWMDILSKLDEICEFIDKQLAMVVPVYPDPQNDETGPEHTHEFGQPIGTVPGGVLVHCRMGISRSATVVIAYLMKKHGQSVDEALAAVRAKRRIVSPNAGFLEQLQAWGKIKYDLWEVPGKVPKREYTEFLRRWDERQEAAKRKHPRRWNEIHAREAEKRKLEEHNAQQQEKDQADQQGQKDQPVEKGWSGKDDQSQQDQPKESEKKDRQDEKDYQDKQDLADESKPEVQHNKQE